MTGTEGSGQPVQAVEIVSGDASADSGPCAKPGCRRCPPGVRSIRRQHLVFLLLCSFVVVAAFLMRVNPDGEKVSWLGISWTTLPTLCMSRQCFGVTCPGCGLTRSFIYLAHGNWWASWHSHRLGWLLAALTVAQIPYRLHGLVRPDKPLVASRYWPWVGIAVVGLLLVNYALGLLWPG